jgi:mannitol-1-phosphate 5-dehydrogenase
MAEHTLTGFGFGPIQAGLFASQARQSGNFGRIVVAEIDRQLVDAVRANDGTYYVNVAKSDGIEISTIDSVELLNPTVERDRTILHEALSQSTEIATCLPSVNFYDSGQADSVARLIAEAIVDRKAEATIIYTAENNNRAAEILEQAVTERAGTPLGERIQFLNTVIGKMSRVVDDPSEIAEHGLKTIAAGIERAFLVEEFNRILVARTNVPSFKPGIDIFIEKDDLLPFEEAKLYGHNAIHALLGFVGALKGYTRMTDVKQDTALMRIAGDAFLQESGAGLVKKYAALGDELFTEAGFAGYAEDLLERITSPYLADTVARTSRDVVRKLSLHGRIFGTMQLALQHGIEPVYMGLAALAGIGVLLAEADENNLPAHLRFGNWRDLDRAQTEQLVNWLWQGETCKHSRQIIEYIRKAPGPLAQLLHS